MSPLDTMEKREPEVTRAPGTQTDEPPPKHRAWIWLLALAVLAGGFWYYRSHQAAKQAQQTAAAQAKAANAPVSVVVATATRGNLPIYLNGLGTVTAFNTVTVHTRIDGQLDSVAFKEGEYVHQGDLLAQIDPRTFQVQLEQAQGQLAKDQALLKDQQVDLERFTALWNAQVIAKQQLDTQAALVGQTKGAMQSDQAAIDSAKLQLTYCRITAPISGRIGLRLVDAGNMVHAADAGGLLVITQVQPIAVLFSLPQEQLPQVYAKIRAGAKLAVEAYGQDNTTKIATGSLLTIDNQIDPTTGTYKLKSVFANPDNILYPNQFVNIRLLVDEKSGLTLVPAAAIRRGPQGSYVYAVEGGNTVKLRPVTIALTEGDTTGLSAGIAPGDVVVTDGQDKIQEGSHIVARAPSGAAASTGTTAPSGTATPAGAAGPAKARAK